MRPHIDQWLRLYIGHQEALQKDGFCSAPFCSLSRAVACGPPLFMKCFLLLSCSFSISCAMMKKIRINRAFGQQY